MWPHIASSFVSVEADGEIDVGEFGRVMDQFIEDKNSVSGRCGIRRASRGSGPPQRFTGVLVGYFLSFSEKSRSEQGRDSHCTRIDPGLRAARRRGTYNAKLRDAKVGGGEGIP